MRASIGDRILIASNQLDRPVRDGKVVELRTPDGSPPYVVQWSDTGRTGLFFPGPDAHVQHLGHAVDAPFEQSPSGPGHIKTWQVELQIFEHGADTTANAILHAESAARVQGSGTAHRNPHDVLVPEIGDEVAVSRALRRLADQLLSTAASDIADVEGHPVSLPR